MRVNIFSCLSAFALGCYVTAATIHEIFEEKTSVILRCAHSVEGKVTWSRESDGRKVDILTVDGDGDIRHNDPFKRYSSLVDKSLHISRVTISDTGRYFCNNEPVVELTVIPSGTVRHNAPERTSVTLRCSHDAGGSDVPTWRTDVGEIQQQRRFHVSPVDKTLTITDVQPGDSGLYYCDGKPAAYLTVIKGDEAPVTTTSTTTTTTTPTTRQTTVTTTTTSTTRQTTVTTTTTPTTRQTTVTTTTSTATTVPLTPPANTDTTTTKKQRQTKKPRKKKDKKNDKKTSPPPTPSPPTTPPTPSPPTTPPTPTATPAENTAAPYLWQTSVRLLTGILYLIVMISITVTTCRKARQKKKRHTIETGNDL